MRKLVMAVPTSMAVMVTLATLALAMTGSTAHAQTYKPDWVTKVVMAGGGTIGGSGTSVTNTLTLTASNSSALTWLLPPDNGAAANYILSNNGSGVLTWINPSASMVAFDVTGAQTSTTAANYLFDVTGAPTAGGTVKGAVITSTAHAGNAGSATGLTITAAGDGVGVGTGLSVTATGGPNTKAIDATGNVAVAGNITITGSGTITSAGLVTGNAGATISGGTINLNDGSSYTTNINTGTNTGEVHIADASGNANSVSIGNTTGTVAVASSGWGVTTGGAFSGASISLSEAGASGTVIDLTGAAPKILLSNASNTLSVKDGGSTNTLLTLAESASKGDLTATGSLNSPVANLTATSNQLTLGTTATTTLSATNTGSARTYTIPDAGGAGDVVITSATPVSNTVPKWDGTAGLITNSLLVDDASDLKYNSVFDVSTLGAVSGVTTLAASSTVTLSANGGTAAAIDFSGTSPLVTLGGENNTLNVQDGMSHQLLSLFDNGSDKGDLTATGSLNSPTGKFTATSNQLVLGTTRTATITAPTPAISSRTYTIPDPSGDASFIMSTMGSAQTIAGGLTSTGTTTLGQTQFPANTATTLAVDNTIDWNLGTANSFYRISSDAAYNVHGIANGADGRIIILVNVGATYAITLKSESATETTDANKFHFPGGAGSDVILAPDGTITLVYDATTQRWRMISAQ